MISKDKQWITKSGLKAHIAVILNGIAYGCIENHPDDVTALEPVRARAWYAETGKVFGSENDPESMKEINEAHALIEDIPREVVSFKLAFFRHAETLELMPEACSIDMFDEDCPEAEAIVSVTMEIQHGERGRQIISNLKF